MILQRLGLLPLKPDVIPDQVLNAVIITSFIP